MRFPGDPSTKQLARRPNTLASFGWCPITLRLLCRSTCTQVVLQFFDSSAYRSGVAQLLRQVMIVLAATTQRSPRDFLCWVKSAFVRPFYSLLRNISRVFGTTCAFTRPPHMYIQRPKRNLMPRRPPPPSCHGRVPERAIIRILLPCCC